MFLKLISFIFFLAAIVMAAVVASGLKNEYFPDPSLSSTPITASQERATSTKKEENVAPPLHSVVKDEVPQIHPPVTEEQAKEKPRAHLPLVQYQESATGKLASALVLKWTNVYREEQGLPSLVRSSLLDGAAILKMRDMFEKGYFEHVSPSGQDIADLARSVNYEYIVIGENLALGDFENEKALVDAWMASPGHRANILKSNFEEIGIAVGKGAFGGRAQWIAVQEFGKPSSSCPALSRELSKEIGHNKTRISDWKKEADTLRVLIESETSPSLFSQKVEEYNGLVAKINALIAKTAEMINQYNASVKVYNACLTS